MKRLLILLLATLLLLTNGCSARPGKTAQGKAPMSPPTGTAEAGEAAALFPTADDTLTYIYDDGTPAAEGVERWVRTKDRIIAANTRGIYAVWYITPDGIYRRDPLAGQQGVYLRYLPAQLQDGLVWQQTSGDSKVRFALKGNAPCRGIDPKLGGQGTCWELRVLNRGQLQAFYFRAAQGIVAASGLNPQRPADSFHKVFQPTGAPAGHLASGEELLHADATTAPFDPAKAPAVESLTAEAFQAAVTAAIGPTVPLKPRYDTERPTFYVVGGRDGIRQLPPLLLLDPQGEEWRRGEPGCQYSFQAELLITQCPLERDGQRFIWLRGWRWQNNAFEAVGWPGHLTVSDSWETDKAEILPNGDVVTYESMADPAGHSRVETRRLDERNSMSVIRTEYHPTEGTLVYPKAAADVLYAALFAHWFDLTAELPSYFVHPDEIARQLPPKLDPQQWGRLVPDKIAVGQLQPAAVHEVHDAPVAIIAAPVAPGKPVDFLFTVGGCCDQVAWLWGKVTFSQSGERWQVANLAGQFAFKPGMTEPTPLAH